MIKDYNVHIPPHLSDVLADLGGVSENSDFDTIINAGRPQLFNFTYPVSQADKQNLEEFILNYYITRRISSGNVHKWRQYLKGKMLEIMPYYKQLLDSEHITFEPLLNNDITTTDDYTGTLDQTNDKRTDNDYQYEKEGSEHGEYTRDETDTENQTVRSVTEASYTKDETDTDNQTKTGNTEGSYSKDIDETDSGTKSVTESGNYSKSGTESTSSTEVNRYSDTPQGDSSRIWELDAQGHPVLNNIFLTDIRGITTSGSRNWNESGTDAKTTNETDSATKDIAETGTNESESTENLTDTKVIDEEGTSDSETNDTLANTKVFDEEGDNDRSWSENGSDERDITDHETIDQDTTHQNTNVHLGVANQSKSSLLNEYRETFLRIYSQIAEELQPLFYNLVEIDDILDFVY